MRRRINALRRGRFIPRSRAQRGRYARGRGRSLVSSNVYRATLARRLRARQGRRMRDYLNRRAIIRRPYVNLYRRLPTALQRHVRSFL